MSLVSSTNEASPDDSSLLQLEKNERDDEIEALRERVASLTAQLETALQQQYPKPDRRANQKRPYHPLSPHAFNVREVRTSSDKRTITAQRERLGRTASISTRQVLDNLSQADDTANHPIIQRILDMFQRPSQHMDYLNSEQFCNGRRLTAKDTRYCIFCMYIQPSHACTPFSLCDRPSPPGNEKQENV